MPSVTPPTNRAARPAFPGEAHFLRALTHAGQWLDRIDPGVHRRIKGLRLVTAYGIAAMLGAMPEISRAVPHASLLSSIAAGFALWASVSEGQATRIKSSRDLLLLNGAAVLGAVIMISLAPILTGAGRPGPELVLVSGAFLVGYLKRFGILGGGIGSQIFIGQLLTYGARLTSADFGMVVVAGMIGALACIVPRVLSGPAELPALTPALGVPYSGPRGLSPELRMGLQASLAALVIVALKEEIHLLESAWAITAATYVVAGSASGTIDRVRRRIIGTMLGVPLALACIPLVGHAPLILWAMAALAMVVYAMALPDRYDIACGAYAFTLLVTLALTGEHSLPLLLARAWETVIGGLLGLLAALFIFPLKRARQSNWVF
jgi:fusaric acid resistance family protein